MKLFAKGRGNSGQVRRHAADGRQSGNGTDLREQYVFRRSRTLTGSAANDVKAPAPARADLQSERLKLHALHQRRRVLYGTSAATVVFACVIWYLLATAITGARLTAAATLSSVDQQKMSKAIQQYVNMYPTEAFAASLNQARFSAYIQQTYPEIASMKFEQRWLGLERTFRIQYRSALAAWQIGDKRFYIDAEGAAFTALHGLEPSLKVEDSSGYAPSNGSSVASKRFIRYLGQLLAAIEQRRIGIIERIVIPKTARELDIYLKDRPYPIKTHIDRDPYRQADDMAAALSFFDDKKIRPQYIDIRVESRAYYK